MSCVTWLCVSSEHEPIGKLIEKYIVKKRFRSEVTDSLRNRLVGENWPEQKCRESIPFCSYCVRTAHVFPHTRGPQISFVKWTLFLDWSWVSGGKESLDENWVFY